MFVIIVIDESLYVIIFIVKFNYVWWREGKICDKSEKFIKNYC